MVQTLIQAHKLERLTSGDGIFRYLGYQFDVFQSGKTRDEVVKLKDKPYVFSSESRQFGIVSSCKNMVAISHRPLGRHVKTAQNIQQRRFSATRGAQKYCKLATVKVKIDRPKGMNFNLAHAIDLRNAAHLKNCFRRDGFQCRR